MKLKLIIILTKIIFCGIVNAQNVHSKRIKAINYLLDSVSYDKLTKFDIETPINLPDSTKVKVIAVLNGYIPPQEVKIVTSVSNTVMKIIDKDCRSICGNDSLCYIETKDSIINKMTDRSLYILRNKLFTENFILAVGFWDVKDAEAILLKNINNPRYPKEETLLALAKLGNDSIKQIIMNKYTLQYIIDNTELKTNDPELIYHQSLDIINDFFSAGMYLKNKQILFNMVDLLDIQGKTYFYEELVPIELMMTMWLSNRFIKNEYIENGTFEKLELITDSFFNQIDNNYKSAKIETILSHENKTIVKNKIKDWINKNVEFE